MPRSAPPAYLLHLIHAATQRVDALYMQALPLGGLTPVQFAVLEAIDLLHRPSGNDIIALTRIDRSTLSDALRRMAGRGLVSKKISKNDRRAHVLRITAAGKSALKLARPVADQAVASLLGELPEHDKRAFLRALQAIVRAGTVPLEA